MSLNQEAIDELKQIHKQEFGEEISNEEAWDMGYNLLRLIKALSRKPVLDQKDVSASDNIKQTYDK
jgi:hypothetical protein